MNSQIVDVSIIIASWGAVRTLRGTVESCLAQEGVTKEIVIVDDCSVDGSYDLALQLAREYPEVRVFRTPRNSGPSAARNIGMREAVGTWIAIMDSDDTMTPTRMADMIAFAEKTRADVVLDNITVMENGQSFPYLAPGMPEEITLSYYALNNLSYRSQTPIGYLQPIMRTDFLRQHSLNYDEKLHNSEDYLFILELLVRKAKVRYLDRCGYNYYIHTQSISASYDPVQNLAFIEAEKNFKAKYGSVMTSEEIKAVDTHLRYRMLSETLFRVLEGAKARSPRRVAAGLLSAKIADMPLVFEYLGRIALKKLLVPKSRFRAQHQA